MKRIFGIAIIALFTFWFTSCDSNSDAAGSESTVEESNSNPEDLNSEDENVTMLEADQQEEASVSSKVTGTGVVRYLNTQEFLAEIFDYNANPKKWVYKGNKPAIIDFYAEWCGPCKRVAPIMDELAKEFTGKVNFYKIDTDKEQQLAGQVFGIKSIPSILYIPANGQPMMYTGLMAKEKYIQLIEENLLK